jgi:hypothetical protein
MALPRLLPRRLRSLHTVGLVLALGLLGWGGWTWYRSSSLVKVEHVAVTGLGGPDVPQIRQSLTAAGLTMTTLSVNMRRLEAAVAQYSFVQRLTVRTRGAHGLVIGVDEDVPVALVQAGGRTEVVDAQGRPLPSGVAHGQLPTVPLSASAVLGASITAPGPRAALSALAAAPYALLAHVAGATSSSTHGVIVQMRAGPQLYFGPASALPQKWSAAVAVLQNGDSRGAAYIDVSDPEHPAAGTAVSPQRATALGLAG